MKLARCPYCGKQIGYFRAFFTRTQGEYYCKKCRKESNVVISKGVFIPFIVAVVCALFILLAFFMLTDRDNLMYMFFVAVPFLIFYLFTPFFVTLKPKKKHMDSLYDTDMVESTITTPDPTMANKRATPTFIDDVILDDDKYKPSIDADVFNTIKSERKAVAETDGGTKPVTSYEELSSDNNISEKTMMVEKLDDIPVKSSLKTPENEDVKIYKKTDNDDLLIADDIKASDIGDISAAKADNTAADYDENINDIKNVINDVLSDDNSDVSVNSIKIKNIDE